MFHVLKRYTFNQYLAFASILLFLMSIINSLRMGFDEVIVLRDVLYGMLAVAFCVIIIIKENKAYSGKNKTNLGNKPLSFILLALAIIELWSIKNDGVSTWLVIPLFYIIAAFTLSNKLKSNIITMLIGITAISGSSLLLVDVAGYYTDRFFYILLLWRVVLFLLLIFLLVYEYSIKKSTIEQSNELSISNQLKELRELLIEEYITREEFEVIKNSIINIHKI